MDPWEPENVSPEDDEKREAFFRERLSVSVELPLRTDSRPGRVRNERIKRSVSEAGAGEKSFAYNKRFTISYPRITLWDMTDLQGVEARVLRIKYTGGIRNKLEEKFGPKFQTIRIGNTSEVDKRAEGGERSEKISDHAAHLSPKMGPTPASENAPPQILEDETANGIVPGFFNLFL